MAEETGEKSEEPTPHQTARSQGKRPDREEQRDNHRSFCSFSLTCFSSIPGVYVWEMPHAHGANRFQPDPQRAGIFALVRGICPAFADCGMLCALAPIFGLTLFVAFAAEALQTGLRFFP